MKLARAAAALLCSPLVWLYGLGVAAVMLVVDVLAAPVVLPQRRRSRPGGKTPATCNASLLVLNYNGAHFLRDLLPSLQVAVHDVPGQHEILVIDNGSTDGSAELVRARFPEVRLVLLPENRFFIRGNRAGVAAARGDILVFVNNDMRVEPDFLRHLLPHFSDGNVFAVTSRIEMQGERVETGRTRATFRNGELHLVQVDGPAEPTIPALWAGGGSSAFDRAKYQALGGFEDLYEPCYVEDVSLSYQAWKAGWHVAFEPRSTVHHTHQGTSSVVFSRRQKAVLIQRNRELFFWRSVTDPAMVLQHALWLPWNVWKRAHDGGLGVQLAALLGTLPRLPAALAARQRSRRHEFRGDRSALAVANTVRRYRRALDGGIGVTGTPPLLLALGREGKHEPLGTVPGFTVLEQTVAMSAAAAPSLEARLRRIPRVYWPATCDGAVADRVRDLLRETDHDVVLFRDPWVLAAAPDDALDGVSVLQIDAPPGTASSFLRGQMARVQRLVHDTDADALAAAVSDTLSLSRFARGKS